MKPLVVAVGRLAILLVTSIAVFGLGHWLVLRPGQHMENQRLEDKLYGLQNRLNEGRAAKRALPLYREDVKRHEQEKNRLLAGAPAGGGISELLSQLRRISAASGVTLQPAPEGDAPENAARITVRGSKRQILAFFAALRDDAYPFLADDLQLVPVEDKAAVLQADLVVASPMEEPTADPG